MWRTRDQFVRQGCPRVCAMSIDVVASQLARNAASRRGNSDARTFVPAGAVDVTSYLRCYQTTCRSLHTRAETSLKEPNRRHARMRIRYRTQEVAGSSPASSIRTTRFGGSLVRGLRKKISCSPRSSRPIPATAGGGLARSVSTR